MSDIIDINVTQTTETVDITITPNLTTVNINSISGGGLVTSVNGEIGDVLVKETIEQVLNNGNIISNGNLLLFSDPMDVNISSLIHKENMGVSGYELNNSISSVNIFNTGIRFHNGDIGNSTCNFNVNLTIDDKSDWGYTNNYFIPKKSIGDYTFAMLSDIPSIDGYIPYTGANSNVDLGNFNLQTSKLKLYDAVAGGNEIAILEYTDEAFIVKNSDDEVLIHIEPSFIQLHKTPSIQSNLFTSGLTITRDHYLPDNSGIIALKSDITGINSGTNTGDETNTTIISKIGYIPYNSTNPNGYTSNLGTVTNVAALTLGTTGTDISSTVVNSITTPVITLNIPNASATNRGALSSADWSTFNGKQNALTNPITGTGTTNYIPKFTGISILGNSSIQDNGSLVTITNPITVNGLQTFQGTVASDTASLGTELTTTATGTNWTGTSFATGYTHTIGSVVALTSSLAAVINTSYLVSFSITGRTAGSVTVFYGGTSSTGSTTGYIFGVLASSTAVLYVLPTTDFDGTVVVSIKTVGNVLPITTYLNSAGVTVNELRGSSSNNNTFLGANSGIKNYNGLENTFIGRSSGNNNISGVYNIFMGSGAGFYNVNGAGNVYIGKNAGYNGIYNSSNTFIGYASGQNTTIGANNVFLGANSAITNTTGSSNIAQGVNAGSYIANKSTAATILNNSIMLGYQTSPLADNQTNQVVIGYNSIGLGSNTTVLGNSSTVTTGIYGNLLLGGTTDYTAKLSITGASLQNGNIFFSQPTPTALTATGTLTITQILTGIETVTSATAVSLTLPTGTLTDAGILGGLLPVQNAFEWTIINLGSSAGIVTLVAGTGHTIVGLATIPILSQGTFRTTKTATNTFVTYRVY